LKNKHRVIIITLVVFQRNWNIMQVFVFFCLLFCLDIKNILKKCFCISIKTKNTDIHYQDSNSLSLRNKFCKLGVIYEDIEYVSILNYNDASNQYIFYS
jgi:hypothetical protein